MWPMNSPGHVCGAATRSVKIESESGQVNSAHHLLNGVSFWQSAWKARQPAGEQLLHEWKRPFPVRISQ
jgi:hypothetical protein